jgi:hypothetical protein
MTEHPVVVIDHPIASKAKDQIQKIAQASAEEITRGLMSPGGGTNRG